VLKPGGVLLIATEPVSAMFRNLKRLRDSTVDVAFDIGINENQPHFYEYYQPLRRSGIQDIRAFAADSDILVPRKLQFIPGIGRFLKRERWTTGWGMLLRHTFSHGQVSLTGVRDTRPLSMPSPMKAAEALFDPDVFVFQRNRSRLVDIWKRLLPVHEALRSITVGRNDSLALRCGFSRKVPAQGGRPYKRLQAVGAFFMQVQPSDRALNVEMQYPECDSAFESDTCDGCSVVRAHRYLTVYQDEQCCECVGEEREADGWWIVRWKLHPAEQTCVTEICMEAKRIFEQEGMPASVKLRRIWIE